jgi:hypothetical protein
MKKFRKLTAMVSALVLAGCMVGSFNVITASADTGGTITINSTKSETHSALKAFEVFKCATNSSGNLSVTGWGSGVDVEKLITALNTAKITSSLEYDSGSPATSAIAAADAISKVTETADLQKLASIIAQNVTGSGTAVDADNKITVNENGYYIVVDTEAAKDSTEKYTAYTLGML